MIDNGHFVLITQSGSTTLHINDHMFILNPLFYVPSLANNLISVKKLCFDNNVIMAILPNSFIIKDLSVRILILEGGVDHGLYKLQHCHSLNLHHMYFHMFLPTLTWFC